MHIHPENRVCDSCGRWVDEEEILYYARLEVYAEPVVRDTDPPEDTAPNVKEWERLIRAMEGMTDEQVEEATAQVHEDTRFYLCPECRRELHQRIRLRKQIL